MTKSIILLCIMSAVLSIACAVPRDCVVVEVVTGTWCQYCPGAAMGVDDMIDNGLRAAIIEYHGGDTFENTASGNRISYYGVSSYPTAFFDGLNSVGGGDHSVSMYSYYLPRYNSRINVNSAFTIDLVGQLEGSSYNVTATINKVETSTATNLYLRAALTESDIVFNWQGQSHLNFVERAMYPSATGTAVNFTSGNTQTVNFSFSINSAWVTNNCELVVFLQNNSTREILQGTKAKIAGLVNAFPISEDHLDFGECVANWPTTRGITIHNYWNQTMSGTIESTNPYFGIELSGRETFEIPPFGHKNYNVVFFPAQAGPYTGDLQIFTNIAAYPAITVPMTGNAFIDLIPGVENVTVSGIPVVFQTLTGTYTFVDIDGDTEGNSQYQWYRLVDDVLTEIPGQTGLTYILQPEDIGKQIAFWVNPYDEHNIPGESGISPVSPIIEQLPAPQNLTAQISDNQNVILNWQAPNHFGRGLFGYRIYRNGASITTISNPTTLTYTNTNLPNGTYTYHVIAIYNNPLNNSTPSNTVEVTVTQSTDNHDIFVPVAVTKLSSAYPNPFSWTTHIRYSLAAKSNVVITIYDVKGRKVRSIAQGSKDAGDHQLLWDGKDENDFPVANGLYICTLQANGQIETVKLVKVK